jgi:GTP-binding protein
VTVQESSPHTNSSAEIDWIEAGRLLCAGGIEFSRAAPTRDSLPPMEGLEVAFAGRSNVGKSSLVNALTGRKALARTSHTPGRTQELLFFPFNALPLTLVDMPGYGYAAVSKDRVQAWTRLIHDYLRGRTNLARVYLLIDGRHGIKAVDSHVMETLDTAAVSYQVLLTKMDELHARDHDARIAQVEEQLRTHPAAFPRVIATSSRDSLGISETRAQMAQLCHEHGLRLKIG